MGIKLTERRTQLYLLGALLVLLGSLRLLWPGEVGWVNDEAAFIMIAFEDNQAGRLTTHALRGQKGIHYGPVAIWFYALLLMFTTDLVLVVIIKTIFSTLLTGLAVFWLAKRCPFLLAPLGAIVFLSPYLWIYGRAIWDNPFTISLCGLALVAYLRFHEEKKSWQFFSCLVLLCLANLIHPMALSVTAGLAIHFLLFHRRWLFKHLPVFFFTLLVCVLLAYPYWQYLSVAQSSGMTKWGPVGTLGFPLLGGTLFSAVGMERYFGRWYFADGGVLLAIGMGLTALAHLFCWLGIYFSAQRVWQRYRYGTQSFEADVCLIVLLIFLMKLVMCFVGRIWIYPHYYNAIAIILLFFIWYGASRAWHLVGVRSLFATYSLGLVVSFCWALFVMPFRPPGHYLSGYGASLEDQIRIVRVLNQYPPETPITIHAAQLRDNPHALSTLRALYPPTKPPTKKAARLEIRYSDVAALKGDLEVYVVEAQP